MSSRYGRGRPSSRGDRRFYDDRNDRSLSRNDRPPSRRGRESIRGRREETPPRRRRERRGSITQQYPRHEDPNTTINQIIRKLERDDRRERARLSLQIQHFAQDPANKPVVEAKCTTLLTLLDNMIEDAVLREQDYNIPKTVGAIGLALGPRCNEVINWLTNRLMAPSSPQVLGFLLNITKYLADDKGTLSTGVLPLIDTIIQLLERIAQPQMIILLLDALVPLTQGYTRFFAPHFTNIIDLLIGWHIESGENLQLQNSISNAFVKFKPFWISDLTYPLTLIMQFVGDAEKEQFDICNNPTIDEEAVKRFNSIVRVFISVLAALGEGLAHTPNVPDFLCKLITQMLDSATALISVHVTYDLITTISGAATVVVKCLPTHFGLVCDQLLCFLIDCISPLESVPAPDTVVISCLQAVSYITENCSSWLGANILTSLIQQTSPLVSLRTSRNEQVLATLFKIYQSLLQLHNFKLLDIVYQFIVQDLHIAIEKILRSIDEPDEQSGAAREEAEVLASVDLALLTEMAASKSHGFSTWALNPNIFELVTSVHSPHNWKLAKHCPGVHYALLNVLHAECKRHGYFLPGAGTSDVVQPQPHNTTSQLCRVLSLLSQLLPHQSLSYDSRYFCLLWVKRIVEIMKKAGECSSTMKFCHKELQELALALIKIADDSERDIRLEVAGCLRLLLLGQLLSHNTQIHCLSVSVLHMGDVDGATRGAFVGVLEAISPYLLLGYEIELLNMDKFTLRPLLQSRHALTYNTEAAQVTSNHFTILMRLILLNQIPGKFIHDDWLERLYFASNSAGNKFNFIAGGVSPCDTALWYWFMWHLALYAVNSRLKTPLGKATETFECIEGILLEILDGNIVVEDSLSYSRGIISGIGSHCYVSLLRSNLLLHFINNLEKLIYNAYEGTVHSIQSCNKTVKNFFVLNRTTCEEWLNRIRPAIAQVCSNTGMHAESWRHTSYIQPKPSALLLLIRSALNMRSPGHLRGLHSMYPDHTQLLRAVELQAAGRYEEAAAMYKVTIDKTQNKEEKVLIAQQTLDCYMALSDWDEITSWSEGYSSLLFTDNSLYCKHYLHALHAFDHGDFTSVAMHLDKVPGGNISSIAEELNRKGGLRVTHLSLELDIPPNADPDRLLYLSQLQLLRVCGLYHNSGDIQLVGGDFRSDSGSYSEDGDRGENTLEKGPEFIFRKLLRQASSLVEVGVRIAGVDLPVLIPGKPAIQLQCVSALHQLLLCDTVKAPTGVPLNLNNEMICLDSSIHEVGSWMYLYRYAHHLYQYFEPCNENSKNMLSSQMVLNLGVSCARLARKQGNVRLAQRLLINELSWHSSGVHPSRPPLPAPPLYIADENCNVIDGSSEVRSTLHMRLSASLRQYIPVDLLPLHSQSAKLLYQCGSHSEAIEALSAAVLYKQRNPSVVRNASNNEDAMKCVLTLRKWLSNDTTLGLMAMSPTFPCLQTLLESEQKATYSSKIKIEDGIALSDVDFLEGRLLRYVAEEAKEMANAWYELATWSYNISKKSLDQLNLSRGETMLPEEKRMLEELTGEHSDQIMNILLGAAISQSTDLVSLRKRVTTLTDTLKSDTLDQICDVYQAITKRLSNNYRIAIEGYCRYLHLSADNGSGAANKIDKTSHKELSTSLRLLKLITSQHAQISDMLEMISLTPALQWYQITPQLLSRLGHSDPAVRNTLISVLCNVARQYPHKLVYNCVERCYVRSNKDNNQDKDDFADMIEKINLEDEEENEQDNCVNTLETDKIKCNGISVDLSDPVYTGYMQVYETLLGNCSDMVNDVQLIVFELRRINLLWAELWVGVLGHRYTDIHRKLSQLSTEVKRVNSNPTLSYEEKLSIASNKKQALLKPLIVLLQRVIKLTNEAGETKYEISFQQKFGTKIKEAMDHLENCVDLKNPTRCWNQFEELHHDLQDYIKSGLLHSLSNISPRLAKLARLSTPLPGTSQDFRSSGYVTIEAFHEEVHVLPTKTKPKKIAMLGSDGRKYTYLFKGLEDLRLDERIMQLLNVCNVMFSSSGHKEYTVRQYSVTPLGTRSGLIQWVSSASPLFSLYKRWQQREYIKNNPDSSPSVLNCSEIFHTKVHAAMTKWNLSEKLPRSEWPPDMLLEVLKQLVQETPPDLLSRELWCSSTSPTHWWSTVQRFTYTSAAMSIIGYVIGLGDRHLDNILVDFQKGDIVHIDYNVCFEKGKGLRVPERVPCRLTTNIQTALGVSGVEGTFRIACEDIMGILRDNKEVVLSLLDAFVYDPLIEWTSANEEGVFADAVKEADVGGASRKELEINSLYSLLSCRLAELNVPLKNNKQAFTASIISLTKSLKSFSESLSKLSPQEVTTNNIIARQRLLCDVKNDPDHSLWQLQERFEAQASHNSSHASLHGKVVTSAEQYKSEQNKFRAILEFIEGNVLETLITQLSKTENSDEPSYLPALEFLKSAGQTELVTQTEQIDSEINDDLVLRRNATITALRALKPYGSIVSFFQRSFVNQHPCSFWADWLGKMTEEPSAVHCDDICAQCELSAAHIYSLPTNSARQLEDFIQEQSNTLKMRLSTCLEHLEQQSQVPRPAEMTVLEEKVLQEDQTSVLLVVGSTLINLNNQWLTMETSVHESASQLGSLNTVTGQWFLDEFVSSSKITNSLIGMLLKCKPDVDKFDKIHKAMLQTQHFIEDLAEVYNTYCTIVLHETLKTLHCGNSDVLASIYEYIQILDTALQDGLTDDVSEVYSVIRDNTDITTKMGEINDSVERIQDRVKSEFHTNDQTKANYKGCLLIMCLESLLSKTIESMLTNIDSYRNITDTIDEIDFLDISAKSKGMRMLDILKWDNSAIYGLLYVTLIQAILSYLQSCCIHVQLFDRTSELVSSASKTSSSGGLLWSKSDTLVHPIKQFLGVVLHTAGIGYYNSLLSYVLYHTLKSLSKDTDVPVRQLEDIQTHVLEELSGNDIQIARAKDVLAAWDAGWHVADGIRRLNAEIKLLKSNLKRCQLELIAYQWLHEQSELSGTPRKAFITDLSSKVAVLKELDETVNRHQDTYNIVESKIKQRLTWAAGANPNTRAVLDKYEEAISIRKSKLDTENKYTADVLEMCNGVIILETQRQETEDSLAEHERLMTMLRKFAESTAIVEEYSKELEESTHLIHMLAAPDKGMTKDWVEQELKDCGKALSSAVSKQKSVQNEIKKNSEGVLVEVEKTKEQAAVFVKIIGEIADHLSSLAREEVQEHGARTLLKSHQKLVSDLKLVLSTIKEFSSKSKREQLDTGMLEDWIKKTPGYLREINNITSLLAWIYTQLDTYAAGSQSISPPPPSLLKITPSSKTKTRLHTVSEKNNYALSVLKKVQNKLDGRDGSVILSVGDQVSSVINAATSQNNLAKMYEGWTPWV